MSAETASKSLFRRALLAFYAVVLGAWLAMLASEIYDVKVVQARNGQAWNQVWAEHVRLQAQLWAHEPQRLQQVLDKLETLRAQEWRQMGYEPPTILLQVWQQGRLIHRFASPDIARRPPPDLQQQHSDSVWLYVALDDAPLGLQVRRWQEVPGDWHLGLNGLAYYARPLFYSVPLVLGLAWWLLRRGFRPLRRMGRQIAQRPAQDLAPLPASDYVELAPVVDGVNSLLDQLREHQQREREFLLDAAHELKTPLAVIQLNAGILGEAVADSAEPRLREAHQRLDEGVRRATHTVHQLLSLSRSTAVATSQERRELDLVALCRDRLALASQLALRHDIEIELQAPEQALLPLHRETMASLIDNLLDNAIKYSPRGSLLSVQISVDTAGLSLAVCDQGPGIPPELHRRVFERFYRMPGLEQAGSGLGLAIVERAAALHGAHIRLAEAHPDAPQGRRGLRVELRFGTPATT